MLVNKEHVILHSPPLVTNFGKKLPSPIPASFLKNARKTLQNIDHVHIVHQIDMVFNVTFYLELYLFTAHLMFYQHMLNW